MKHTSRLFGEFTYTKDQIITFPNGLLGFSDFKEYVLKSNPDTEPIKWLLSVEDGGPELALIDPDIINSQYSVQNVVLDERSLQKLRCENPDMLKRFAIITLPDNIRHMSINLRTPVFINPHSMRGLEMPKPGLEGKPVRCYIYRDLIRSRPEDELGMLIVTRKENETVDIGDEITVQILKFENGGVKLGITAPKRLSVKRGEGKVTPLLETKRANEAMNLRQLKGIMHMYRVMQDPDGQLEAAALERSAELDVVAG